MFENVHEIFAAADDGQTVMQTDEAHRDPIVVARALSHVTGLPVIDVTATVRKHHGPVVLENLRPEVAEALVKELQRDGLAVQAVSSQRVHVPRFMGTVDGLDYEHGHLDVVARHRHLEVPWESVALISLAWVELHELKKELAPGEVSHDMRGLEHLADLEVKVKQVTEKMLVADLFYVLPEGCSYIRLLKRHLPYAHLGARMQTNSRENFLIVLQDIVERCPNCQLNDNCRKFLAGEGLPPLKEAYHTPESFDEENLRLLKLPY